MRNENIMYKSLLEQLREIDSRIRNLESCFLVISEPKMLDAVNYQILGLKMQRDVILQELRPLYQEK